ncbi:MAG TPA: acyloxyacyl hydrolase [Pyrinomonadaceae bacterium]|jgi:opacity protein-like surface antigen
MKKLLLFALLLFVFGVTVFAQEEEEDEYKTGKNEFSAWGGFSPDTNTFLKIGRTPDARFGSVSFRYARRFNNSGKVNLKYTVDFTPVAVLNYPDIELARTPTGSIIRSTRPTRYAWGIAPLGLRFNFRPRRRVQPFAESTGGFLYFNKTTPNFGGTRFNFTIDVGGGLEFKLKNKRALTVGYKYYHISNGFRGDYNPGYDNNLIYLGYTFFSK